MRLFALAGILTFACRGAWAEGSGTASPFSSDDLFLRQKACKSIGEIAETIMKQRQQEVPMSEMISRLQAAQAMGIFDNFGLTPELIAAMVTAAYKQPAFSSPELQANMVAAYRNEAEVLCFEGKLGNSP
jgi:hypothetical protein